MELFIRRGLWGKSIRHGNNVKNVDIHIKYHHFELKQQVTFAIINEKENIVLADRGVDPRTTFGFHVQNASSNI